MKRVAWWWRRRNSERAEQASRGAVGGTGATGSPYACLMSHALNRDSTRPLNSPLVSNRRIFTLVRTSLWT